MMSFLWVHFQSEVLPLTLMHTDEPPIFLAVDLIAEDARPRIISGGTPDTGPVTKLSSIHANKWQPAVFRRRVRERDQVCRVTGQDDRLTGFIGVNACHIIPRHHFFSFVQHT